MKSQAVLILPNSVDQQIFSTAVSAITRHIDPSLTIEPVLRVSGDPRALHLLESMFCDKPAAGNDHAPQVRTPRAKPQKKMAAKNGRFGPKRLKREDTGEELTTQAANKLVRAGSIPVHTVFINAKGERLVVLPDQDGVLSLVRASKS